MASAKRVRRVGVADLPPEAQEMVARIRADLLIPEVWAAIQADRRYIQLKGVEAFLNHPHDYYEVWWALFVEELAREGIETLDP